MTITAFLSHSPGLLNQGLGAQPLWDMLSHSSIFSPTATSQSGSWGPPLLGADSLYRILCPTDLTSCLHQGYIIVRHPPLFVGVTNHTHLTRPRSRLYPDIPRPDASIIYTGAFLIWLLGRGQYDTICCSYLELKPDIGLAVRVFANGPGDLGSIPGRVIPKTQKMVLDASLLNTQHYKVQIKGKVEQSRERSSALPYTLV